MINQVATSLFHLDALAIIVIALVAFIGMCVGSFAYRYMRGDSRYRLFLMQLSLLIISVLIMVSANHLLVLFSAWCVSNILLILLMIHKSNWQAAKASGILAAKYYLLSAACIAAAFAIFYYENNQTSIKTLNQQHTQSIFMIIALGLLLIGAMIQSAIFPFHRWLTSSLNSPTPVSAIMHAGLINGGGFILARFAPLYLEHPNLLTIVFVIGISTALIGTLWKLIQTDIKRMLACSTMAQMGFMLAQCGLGLFPAAVAHLVWHGMFKAYLFLASGSAAQEKRFNLDYPPNPFLFISALFCGLLGSFGFAFASGKSWLATDTTLVLMIVSFISAAQFSLPMLGNKTLKNLPFSLIATTFAGLVYGTSVRLFVWAMEPMQVMQPQVLNGYHIASIIAITLAWLSILFIGNSERKYKPPTWLLKGYVTALNASQPDPSTVTAHRNQYKYL
jgi:NAD(P)H-quinone oxidoreductase subunit 5